MWQEVFLFCFFLKIFRMVFMKLLSIKSIFHCTFCVCFFLFRYGSGSRSWLIVEGTLLIVTMAASAFLTIWNSYKWQREPQFLSEQLLGIILGVNLLCYLYCVVG